MRSTLAALALALIVTGCGQADFNTRSDPATSAANGYAEMAQEESARGGVDMVAQQAPAPAPPPPSAPGDDRAQSGGSQGATQAELPGGPAPVLYLAYSYQVGLELPAPGLAGVLEAHVAACQGAGVRMCQLVGSNVSGDPESAMNGYVSLRGEPAWLRTFMASLEADADAAGGRILSETTNTEDLTRAIVDTEARLRAQTTLRDRLQQLLRSRPGRLSDLLEVERELARVQADIDSVQSNLAVMRTRVAMSELTLQYQSSPRSLRSDTFRPLGEAFANFLGFVVAGFAAIITLIAVLLPWLIIIIPAIWFLLRWRRTRGGRFFGKKEAAPPTPN